MRRRTIGASLLLTLAALAAGCGSEDDAAETGTTAAATTGTETTAAPAATAARDVQISVVTHGQASDPFWSVFKNGVDAAAKDMGVTVTYQAPQTFDMVAMSQLIDAEVAKEPDGLVVSIPDAQALKGAIDKAVAAGIPVISANSGSDVFQELGILTHVGQTEYEAGVGAGQRMGEAGVKKAICVNQEVGNAALDLRCKGFADGLKESGGSSEVVAVELADPTGTAQRVGGSLSGVEGVLTLGPTGAVPTLEALRTANQLGTIKLATFDLSPEVLDALKNGEMEFAIDQQQYLQGYLPVVFLTQFKLNGLMPGGGGVIPTGPGFVTKDTAEQVIELSKQGIR
jgi:simple sugar transport system substrate-binding protein